jgi:hypothetical protein
VFQSENPVVSKRLSIPLQQHQTTQPVAYSISPEGDVESVPGPVMRSGDRSAPQIQNASYGRTEDRVVTRRKPVPRQQPDLEFYPLTFAGDPVETTSGGRVLQVELSRSSLFAMGFNVPIENGAEFVKADLLVGPDGVARAIRLH